MTRGRSDVPRVGRRKNELKLLALNYLINHKDVTSKSMSKDLDISEDNARMILFRVQRQGLAIRFKVDPHSEHGRQPYAYNINDRGIEKKDYLTSF